MGLGVTGCIAEPRFDHAVHLRYEKRMIPASYPHLKASLEFPVDCIAKYLSYPYITDDFTNHNDRRAWERTLPAQQLGFLNENALSNNRLSTVFLALDQITKAYHDNPQVSGMSSSIMQQIPRYRAYGERQEKMRFVEGIRNDLETLLQRLAA